MCGRYELALDAFNSYVQKIFSNSNKLSSNNYYFSYSLQGKAVIAFSDGSQTVMCNDDNGNVIGNKRKFKQSINHSNSYILETIEDYKGKRLNEFYLKIDHDISCEGIKV